MLSSWSLSISDPSVSICLGRRRWENSTTVTSCPVFLRLLPASRPSTPPPIRRIFLIAPAYSIISRASLNDLKVNTPFLSEPFIGGIKEIPPVARSSLPYSSTSPFSVMICFLLLSISETRVFSKRLRLFFLYHMSSWIINPFSPTSPAR